MRVWVAEQGAYSSRGIIGVYATAEAAMADNPVPVNARIPTVPTASNMSRPGGWQQDKSTGAWDNGLDWDDGISIEPYDVQGLVVIPAEQTEEKK